MSCLERFVSSYKKCFESGDFSESDHLYKECTNFINEITIEEFREYLEGNFVTWSEYNQFAKDIKQIRSKNVK
jgi:hypothetical protein